LHAFQPFEINKDINLEIKERPATH